MTDQRSRPAFYTGPIYRVLMGAFGLFLIGIGLYAIFADPSAMRIAGGVAIAIVGCNSVYASYNSKESWISKIGPLP